MRRLTLLSLLVLGGCTKILGLGYDYRLAGDSTTTTSSSTGTGGGGAAAACGAVWDPLASCEQCVESHCCNELETCAPGTGCGDVSACAAACDPKDIACLTVCINADYKKTKGQGAYDYGSLAVSYTHLTLPTILLV